jgi:hypothetical protein
MMSNAFGWLPDLPVTPDPPRGVRRIVIVHGTPDPHLAVILAESGLEIVVATATSTIWAPSTVTGPGASRHPSSLDSGGASPAHRQSPPPSRNGAEQS